MTTNICQTNAGVLGEITVSPENIIIKTDFDKSENINIRVQPFGVQQTGPVVATGPAGPVAVANDFSQQPEQASVVVTIRDQFNNNIEGIDFEFTELDILTFSIEKDLSNNSFSYIIENVSPTANLNTLSFKIIKTNKFIANINASINFNAITSGFGTLSTMLVIEADSAEPLLELIEEELEVEELTQEEIDKQKDTLTENIFSPKINSEYNFYISKYEDLISENFIPENAIPNINYLYAEFGRRNVSLNNVKSLYGLLNEKIAVNTERPLINIKDFFEEFTLEVSQRTKRDNNFLSSYRSTFHILFPNNYSKKLLLDVENKKENFPMSTNFEILLENNKTQLNTFLKKLNILDYFCYCLVNEYANPTTISIDIQQFFDKYFPIRSSSSQQILRLERDNFVYLGDMGNISAFNNDTRTNFLKSISSAILISKYTDFFINTTDTVANSTQQLTFTSNSNNNQMRTHSQQILATGRDQVVMYEVHKKFGDTSISRNYFINDFETEFLKFYDTQVKYDKQYSYEINKIVCLDTEIRKINILSKNLKVFDFPPIMPQVNYVGYRGQDDKILITLNSSTGKFETQPEIVFEEDAQKFEKNKIEQERVDDKIKFASDDIPAQFELMRLDKEPYSYKDFSNGKIIPLSNKIGGVVKFTANSFVDDIEPNKKYYYIARSRDVHDNISNPTAPMQIEMINENGTIYLIKKEYIFKNIPKTPTKEFKKYIEIKVAENQASINPRTFTDNSTTAKNLKVYLGNAEKSVWEKEFLLRVTSKTTGKKVDVKFKFNFTQPPLPETTQKT
jgi:hypothetical protein